MVTLSMADQGIGKVARFDQRKPRHSDMALSRSVSDLETPLLADERGNQPADPALDGLEALVAVIGFA